MSDLTTLVDEFIDAKPEASPFADELIKQEIDAQTDTSNSDAGSDVIPPTNSVDPVAATGTDHSQSEVFDPAIHATDSAGNPIRKKDGSGYAKKRGRRSWKGQASRPQAEIDLEISAKNSAIVTVQTIVICGHVIGGEEWKPESAELYAMNAAWTDYYKSRGITNIPPWLGIVVATGAYVAPRLGKPKTRERLKEIWSWMKPSFTWIGKTLCFWR